MNEVVLSLFAGGGIGALLDRLMLLGVEALRQHWSKSERRYLRGKEIVDRRCNQAETYAQNVAAYFRRVMDAAEAYLTSDEAHAAEIAENGANWRDSLDKRLFALGPAIRALSDEDLMKSWNLMMEALDELHKVYVQAGQYRFERKPVQVDLLLSSLGGLWLDLSQQLSQFYKRLDQIRYKLSEDEKLYLR